MISVTTDTVSRQTRCLSTDTVSVDRYRVNWSNDYLLFFYILFSSGFLCDTVSVVSLQARYLSSMASTVDTPNKGSGLQHDRKSWEVAFAEWLQQPGKSKKMWTSDYMKSVVAALSLNDEDVAAMEAGPEKKRVRVWRTRFALVNIAAEGSKAEYVVVRQGGEQEGKRCMHTKGGGVGGHGVCCSRYRVCCSRYRVCCGRYRVCCSRYLVDMHGIGILLVDCLLLVRASQWTLLASDASSALTRCTTSSSRPTSAPGT